MGEGVGKARGGEEKRAEEGRGRRGEWGGEGGGMVGR